MNETHSAATYDGSGEPQDVLRWALARFHPDIALATSFENTVLMHMMTRIRPDVRVFSIDTGRLPEETYACADEARRRFGIRVEWFFPDTARLEQLVRAGGVYGFRDTPAARHQCCRVRKVEPLSRALHGLRAWITGVRREETSSRRHAAAVDVDTAHGGIFKINPLVAWTDAQVLDYTREHQLPCNRLRERGFASIGCACCTRAVEPGEDARAGRWWWEQAEHKECGLHLRDWQI